MSHLAQTESQATDILWEYNFDSPAPLLNSSAMLPSADGLCSSRAAAVFDAGGHTSDLAHLPSSLLVQHLQATLKLVAGPVERALLLDASSHLLRRRSKKVLVLEAPLGLCKDADCFEQCYCRKTRT